MRLVAGLYAKRQTSGSTRRRLPRVDELGGTGEA